MLNKPIGGPGNSQPFAETVLVQLSIGANDTCQIGNLVGFLWSSAVDSYLSFPTTADNSARYFGVALQSGVNGDKIRVQVSGLAEVTVHTKNTDTATPGYVNVQQGQVLTPDNTGSGINDELMPGFCRPESGDMIVAQVLAGEPTITAPGSGSRNVMLFGMNPYPHP